MNRATPRKPVGKALPDAGERLSKRVMQLKGCSRSEAEQFIEGGWVQVNGKVTEEPQHRVAHETITIDPHASLLALTPVTLVLNKPAQVPFDKAGTLLTVKSHCAQDVSGIRVLKRHFQKLESLVPLETGATGLVVFTQDWRTERKLLEDMDAMEHELIADVGGEAPPEALQKIARLLKDERHPLPAVKFSVNSSNPERSKLRFAVKGAHPGLVAHLCEKAGLELMALRRIRLGRVALSDMPVGQWRYVTPLEKF
jgi:23S rRNA pseudouridine2604 synthase